MANNNENIQPNNAQTFTTPDDQKRITHHDRVLENRKASQKAAKEKQFGQPTGRVFREPFFQYTKRGQRLWRVKNHANMHIFRGTIKK